MPAGKYNARLRTPTCRKCGSTDLTATSSTQFRMIGGRRRQAADVVCNNCDHTWWSVNPRVRAMAKAADAARRLATLKSGKKQRTAGTGKGFKGRVVETKAPRVPRAWTRIMKSPTSKNAGAGKRSRIAQGAAGPIATGLPDRIKPRALDMNVDLRRR